MHDIRGTNFWDTLYLFIYLFHIRSDFTIIKLNLKQGFRYIKFLFSRLKKYFVGFSPCSIHLTLDLKITSLPFNSYKEFIRFSLPHIDLGNECLNRHHCKFYTPVDLNCVGGQSHVF